MKRVFVKNLTENELIISGSDANHLARSLRARRGDKITAVDNFGHCAVIELTDFNNDTIKARRIGEIREVIREKKIILADCLPKQNRFDKIEPLISERTIARPGGSRENSKIERWKRIAKEAAEQCARDSIPEIGKIRNLNDWLKEISPINDDTLLLFCWENEKNTIAREILRDYKNSGAEKNIIVLIGPEGGFSEREVKNIKEIGGISISLGKRILKTDTAAISILAMINYEFM